MEHPKRCAFFSRIREEPNGLLHVRDISTQHLDWRSWGKIRATAQGEDSVGNNLKIVAYHRVLCGDGITYYTLVHIRRPSGRTYRMKLAKCGQPRFRLPSKETT